MTVVETPWMGVCKQLHLLSAGLCAQIIITIFIFIIFSQEDYDYVQAQRTFWDVDVFQGM